MKIRLDIKAIKNPIKVSQLKAAVAEGLDVGANDAQALLTRPTATWQHKAPMRVERGESWRAAGTDDPIYGYVSTGTRPHVIRAKRVKVLAFGPSSPKTQPGSLGSSGGARGPASTFRQQVNHPGTKARKFDEAAATELEQTFPATVQRKLTEAANG